MGVTEFVDGLKSCNWSLWSKFTGVLAAALLMVLGGMALTSSAFSNLTAWWAVISGIFVVIGECHGMCPCCGSEGSNLKKLCTAMDSYFVRAGIYTLLTTLGIVFHAEVASQVGCLLCFCILEVSAVCYVVTGCRNRANAGGDDLGAGSGPPPAAKATEPRGSFASSLFAKAAENPEAAKKVAGAAMKYAEENPEAAKQAANTAISYGQQNPEWAKGVATGSAYGASSDANPFAV